MQEKKKPEIEEQTEETFTLQTEEGMNKVLDHVVNGMAQNKMNRSQADPINTAIKQKLNLERMRLKYAEMYLDVHKGEIRSGAKGLTDVSSVMPEFFNGAKRLEQGEEGKEE